MAAGFASEFKEEPFNGEKMEIVRSALIRMLEKHEPYPAMLINAAYDILMHNSGYQKVMKALVGEEVFVKPLLSGEEIKKMGLNHRFVL